MAFEFKFERNKEEFVRGVSNENIEYFIQKSGVKNITIKYTPTTKEPYIYCIGSEESIETFKHLLEYHLSFYAKWREGGQGRK